MIFQRSSIFLRFVFKYLFVCLLLFVLVHLCLFIHIFRIRSRKFSSHENLDRVLKREEGKRWSQRVARKRRGGEIGADGDQTSPLIGFENPDDHATSTKHAEIAADFGEAEVGKIRELARDSGGGGNGGGGGGGGGGGNSKKSEAGKRESESMECFGDANFEESLGYLP